MTLAVIIPKFLSQYLVYVFVIATLIEALLLNVALKRKLRDYNAFIIAGMLKFTSIFIGFFFLRVLMFETNTNLIIGFILFSLFDYFFAEFMLEGKIGKGRLLGFLSLANFIVFGLVFLNSSWLF